MRQGVNAAMEAATVLDKCIGRALSSAKEASSSGADAGKPHTFNTFNTPSPLQERWGSRDEAGPGARQRNRSQLYKTA